MAERLGEVLFWAAVLVATAIGATGGWLILTETRADDRPTAVFFVLVAVGIVYLIGRACRYILSGR